MADRVVDVMGAKRIIIVGTEGSLKVTDADPVRRWIETHRVGEKAVRLEDVVMLQGGGMLGVRGRFISDGAYSDVWDNGKRRMFYVRIMPNDAREELCRLDTEIADAERRLAQLRRDRQDHLASAARRGARVPAPPQPPKPTRTMKE